MGSIGGVDLSPPEPTCLQVPKMKPYIKFLETLQNSGFWLVKIKKPGSRVSGGSATNSETSELSSALGSSLSCPGTFLSRPSVGVMGLGRGAVWGY